MELLSVLWILQIVLLLCSTPLTLAHRRDVYVRVHNTLDTKVHTDLENEVTGGIDARTSSNYIRFDGAAQNWTVLIEVCWQ